MACEKRRELGYCGHYQCPHPDKTDHGYECVEIVDGFCEVGYNCYPACPHSYRADSPEEAAAYAAFETKYPPLSEDAIEVITKRAYS